MIKCNSKRINAVLFAAVSIVFLNSTFSAYAQQSTREIRESANAKLAAGAFADAISDLESLIDILGNSKKDDIKFGLEHVYFSLALCHFLTGDFGAAEPAFLKFTKLYPRSAKCMEAAVYIADAQRFTGNGEKAIKSYTEALKKYPYGYNLKTDIFIGIARCYLAADDWKKAIEPLSQAVRNAPDPMRRSWAATMLATSFLKTVDLPRLYPLIPNLLTENSFAGRSIAFNLAALEAGDALFAEERYREALWVHRLVYPHDVVKARSEEFLEYLRKRSDFESRRPNDPRVLMRLQENIGELEGEVEAIGQIDNYDLELEYRVARGYMEQMRHREACELFLHLHEIAEKEFAEESLFLAFQCATRFLPWERAYGIGEKYMETYPDGEWFEPITLIMGQMYAKEEKWTKVIEHLAVTLQMRPAHQLEADCRFLMGYACFMEERFEDCVENFKVIRTKFPQHELISAAVYWTAMAYLFDGDYENAAKDFDEVLRNHKESMYGEDSMFRRAVCSYGLAQYEDADSRFADFVSKYPQSKLVSEATMTRGDIAGVLGDIEAAVAFYQNAMTLDSLNIEHYNHCAFQCGQILTDAEKWAEAKDHFQKYMEQNLAGSNLSLAAFWIGKCLIHLQDERAALHFYQRKMAEIGKDRTEIGVDMILDEWIGLTRKLDEESANKEWLNLQKGLRDANASNDRTTALRLTRMLMYHPKLKPSDRDSLIARLLDRENFDFASPSVLQFIIDTAKDKGLHDLAKEAANRMIEDFTETDYALDARMTLADYAIKSIKSLESDDPKVDALYAEAIRHLGVVREVYASSGEAAKALLQLGELFVAQRKFAEADQAYKDILGNKEWRSSWPEAIYGRGMCEMYNRHYLEACAHFERIYLMYGGYAIWAARAYLRRAECLQRMSEGGKAVETLKAMLELPDFQGRTDIIKEMSDAKAMLAKLSGEDE